MTWVAPALAVAAALAGFFLGNAYDLPPAHATVALLAALLPLVWLRHR
jgi:ABC-type Mn2+/Zn2+ transport system permease subunit